MADENRVKRMKTIPSSETLRQCIIDTKEPIVLKNILDWNLLQWSLDDWIKKLDSTRLNVRVGTSQCTKVPQWENICEVVSVTAQQLFNHDTEENDGTWMYFDYKHLKHNFKNKSELLESVTWKDFGFPDENDSTIWIGTKGAYTPCHMDSYGCNIVAQVYGRKQWVMFPPSNASALKATRVPYEESSTYSDLNLVCGLNVNENLGEAHVVVLSPGDVLIVPNHWWHQVENLSTAISINTWIPKESDHSSRLEESLVRYFVAMTLKNMGVEGDTPLLNPNETDLLDEPVDVRQISWCLERVLSQRQEPGDEVAGRVSRSLSCVSPVCRVSAGELRRMQLNKCGCKDEQEVTTIAKVPRNTFLTTEDVINAFCHPETIAKVAQVLVSSKRNV